MKKQNGITLISLIITIIVMLIIAGVALSAAFGDNNMISQALKASEETGAKAQIEEQAIKNASDYVYQKTNLSDSTLSHSGAVPEGAYYANLNTGTFYDTMPETINDGDAYLYGDYLYVYNFSINGWHVNLATESLGVLNYVPNYQCTDREQTTYGKILENINGKPIVSMHETFKDCNKLIESPIIPQNVSIMTSTFYSCTELTKAPKLPSNLKNMETIFIGCYNLKEVINIPIGVTNMYGSFYLCNELNKVPAIPNSVTNMQSTFHFCHKLTGVIEINANPTNYENCFYGVNMSEITITGSCSDVTKANLVGTSSN